MDSALVAARSSSVIASWSGGGGWRSRWGCGRWAVDRAGSAKDLLRRLIALCGAALAIWLFVTG